MDTKWAIKRDTAADTAALNTDSLDKFVLTSGMGASSFTRRANGLYICDIQSTTLALVITVFEIILILTVMKQKLELKKKVSPQRLTRQQVNFFL